MSVTVAMDVIKKEPESDPLAVQWSDETDIAEKPLSEERNSLDLHIAGIKTECVDHSYDVTTDFRVEETALPANFVTVECKAEEELCVQDTVKDELKLELMPEENEIVTDSRIMTRHIEQFFLKTIHEVFNDRVIGNNIWSACAYNLTL
ncbi:uncharacterized protein [Periplaneta americana]|uniref:uncharacterized protein isoform X3 n=1 Tax=Periplaneta americana TaxID=6978 RepID=UPI0037E74434